MIRVAFAPPIRERYQDPVHLLRLSSEDQAGANLPKAAKHTKVREIVEDHVGAQDSLAHETLLSHPRGGLLLLNEILIPIKDPLCFLLVILGRFAYRHIRFVQR